MKIIQVPRMDDKLEFVPVTMLWNSKNSNKTNLAAIIHNHGGGMTEKRSFDLQMEFWHSELVLEEDVVMFYVDYRLAPQTKVPGAQEDCYQVIKYVNHNSNKLGIDKSKIALMGESAGAHVLTGALQIL